MNVEKAIVFLRKYVKESAVPGQKHISPDLVNAQDLKEFEQAMESTNNAVLRGELTREDLMLRLGLN